MTTVWRIGFCEDPAESTSQILLKLGYGSRFGNGRWHLQSPLQMVYAGSSRALCQLEKRVHCNGFAPKGQALMRLELPQGAALMDVHEIGLDTSWRHDDSITQSIGMNWLASNASLGLWVPSYIEPQEKNLLLNPQHPQYAAIELVMEQFPFVFDPRLFG